MTETGIAYCSPAVPAIALLVMRRAFPREYWTVAMAFAVSFFIDAAVRAGDGAFAGAHVVIAIQMMVFAWAMPMDARSLFVCSAVGAIAASGAPLVMSDDPHRMVLVTLVMLPLLAWHAWHWQHPLKYAVGVYVVVAGLLSAWMVQYYPHDPEAFENPWRAYQLARFAAFGLFIRAAINWREA